jgi:hypothetical protein
LLFFIISPPPPPPPPLPVLTPEGGGEGREELADLGRSGKKVIVGLWLGGIGPSLL